MIQQLDLADLCQTHGKDNLLVWLKLTVQGREVSRNLVTFARPKNLELHDPKLQATIQEARSGFRVTLTSPKPALWAWLALTKSDATYSDNFVHLPAHVPIEILVTPKAPLSKAGFADQLRVRSLFDTYCPGEKAST
jgi:beta-galactosidase/beta-glucuronidase